MGKVIVFNSLTLDGVMQAPGGPDEDPSGGFTHGGWAMSRGDSVTGSVVAEGMSRAANLLLGRRTYEIFASYWPYQSDENQFTRVMNDSQKYVASRTLTEPLSWQNSTLLKGDAGEAVAKLKGQTEKDFVIFGSGELIRSLLRRNLIDRFLLLIHPLVLGSGRHLFADGSAYTALRLVDVKPSTTGVLIATYEPAEPTGT